MRERDGPTPQWFLGLQGVWEVSGGYCIFHSKVFWFLDDHEASGTNNVGKRWGFWANMTPRHPVSCLTREEANLSVSWLDLGALLTETQCPWWSAEFNACSIHQGDNS